MMAARHQRFILGSEIGVSVYRSAQCVRAVISLFQAEKFNAPGVTPDLVVLARQPEGDFNTV